MLHGLEDDGQHGEEVLAPDWSDVLAPDWFPGDGVPGGGWSLCEGYTYT